LSVKEGVFYVAFTFQTDNFKAQAIEGLACMQHASGPIYVERHHHDQN
jgi:hypothetical protein